MDVSNLPDLRVRELLAIVAIADSGSFVAATRLLKMGLPTLSRTVQRIERVVGVRLFERTTRRVEITPAGRAFVAIAQRLLSDLQLSLQNLGDVAAEQRGQVAIATFGIFAHEMLPPIFREYLRTRPEIQLQVHAGPFTDVLERVVSGQCDFGITYADTLPATVNRITLRKEPMYVVLPHDHPLGATKKASISLPELQGVPLVSLAPDTFTRRLLDGAAASAGVWLKHAVIVPGFLDVLNHVSAGIGVGIVPSGVMSDRFLTRLKARPLRPTLSMSIGLIAIKSRHVTPAASALMRLVLETVRQHETALRTEFLTSSLAAFEDLPHGPYELLWRPAIPSVDPREQSGRQRGRKSSVRRSNTRTSPR
jgi:DNA-binding transcriptional LysR family regulator